MKSRNELCSTTVSTFPLTCFTLCFDACCHTSRFLPDGWTILLQHPVPVSWPPWPSRDEPWRDGPFQARASTFHRRLVPPSPQPGPEDEPARGISRRTARAQTALPCRGLWTCLLYMTLYVLILLLLLLSWYYSHYYLQDACRLLKPSATTNYSCKRTVYKHFIRFTMTQTL